VVISDEDVEISGMLLYEVFAEEELSYAMG
jgi:hypothetical protein